ncbi:substrate-binding domain-containing protein [Anaerorudis cellulosivorans]|uniref:substrate-binding domain-containing protein n=1 Tax=Anaerorudis cellulosivorans TaxID=3397862 RepID=UPI002220231B|nr:substrate-binding domain-containing protein [Seramator thermalis]MCW1734257.1 substrate-binding domain-containing protein [Seramator thermalis]
MQKVPLILLFLFTLFFTESCDKKHQNEKYTIGFSQCMMDDVWRQAMMIEMNIEASNYENLEIIVRDAEENNQKQIDQIKELIRKKVDVLIISPNESDEITPIAVEAYKAGIPTIILDRKINSDEYTTYIGGDSYEIGKMAGTYASSLLPKEATILEVWGTKSTSPAQERHKGFMDGLDKNKNFTLLSIEGKWRKEIAHTEARKFFNSININNIDLVYAHNDVMALGVREAIIEIDSTLISNIKILGVDGAFGKDAGLEAVSDGRLDASFLYPTGGDLAIRIAMKILKGKPVDKKYILDTALIDKHTAKTLLLQSNQLINYQNKIEQQRKSMEVILNRFSGLRHSLFIILVLMSIIIAFTIYIFFINKKIEKSNAQLKLKNEETEKQKHELIQLNEMIQEVTNQKVRFFMNISHEIRTPLTLIVSPLEKWIKNTSSSPLHDDLLKMKRNTDRLICLINQLLDFKKIESNTSTLDTKNTDIVALTTSAKNLFDDLAEKKNITYSFTSNTTSEYVLLDPDKIDKVLVNLLSNAFKFTKEGGVISINLSKNNNTISISITDNGCGIEKDKQSLIFERFYTTKNNNNKGTGIGLHLAQEFVKMHGGKITVESVPEMSTTFTVQLPIVQENYADIASNNIYEVADIITSNSSSVDEILNKKYNYTILIVEDDPDIMEYLSSELSDNLKIVTATNGSEALNILNKNDEISLVLSDVLMPETNGFTLCKTIKSTPELSYIPVILLTALTEENQRIFGIAEGADDYIPKPFNIDYVKIKIIKLLENRKQLQNKFMQDIKVGKIPIVDPTIEIETADKIFIQKFASLIASKFNDPAISIEKISKELGVSRVHLQRKVKEITGLNPIDYLRIFRLAKAVELLESSHFSISEVAYETGFSSPAYFSKCFKDAFNVTPSEYIKDK